MKNVRFELAKKAEIGQFSKSYLGQLLSFIGVFLAATLVQAVVPCLYIWDDMAAAMTNSGIDRTDSQAIYKFYMQYDFGDAFMILSLFSTALGILITFLYCRGFERRKISSLGFVRKNAVKSYLLGALAGFAMFAVCVLVCAALGAKIKIADDIAPVLVLAYLGGFIVQGMYEEVLFRGCFFVSTAASKKPLVYAIAVNSILFSVAHGLNSGVTILAFVNIALFGVLMSVCMIKTENIWFVGALHSFWNFTQGNFFGVNTSGMEMNATIFEFDANNQSGLINGGAFGLEGGIVVTVAVCIAIAVVVALIKKESTQTTER